MHNLIKYDLFIFVSFLIPMITTIPIFEADVCSDKNNENCAIKKHLYKISPKELCEICYVVAPFIRELIRKKHTKEQKARG